MPNEDYGFAQFIKDVDCVMIGRGTYDFILKLKAEGFKKVYIDGGKVISNELNENLISDILISIMPIIIEDGILLFKEILHDTKLK